MRLGEFEREMILQERAEKLEEERGRTRLLDQVFIMVMTLPIMISIIVVTVVVIIIIITTTIIIVVVVVVIIIIK